MVQALQMTKKNLLIFTRIRMTINGMNNEIGSGFLFDITFWTTVIEELINVLNLPRVKRFKFVINFHSAREKIENCYLIVNVVNLFFVTDNISFIIESFLTNVTLIQSDFVMDHSNMSV